MNKYKVGYVVLVVDIISVTNNVFAIIALMIINSTLYGFDSMLNYH